MTDFTHHTPRLLSDADAAADLAGLARPSLPSVSTALETALNRIEDMLSDDDGQAFKEARKFLPVGRAALAAQPGVVGEPVASVRVEGGMMRGATRRPGMASLPDGDHKLYAAAPTEAKPAQDAVDAIDWAEDARMWGNALNSAGWEFDGAYRRHIGKNAPAELFNFCKPIIRDVILKYAERVAAISAKKGGAA